MVVGLVTYQDAARREDLVDILTNISPQRTPLLSGLMEGPAARGTLHEYLRDTLVAAASESIIEGAGFTVADLTQPTRSNNVTQIFLENIQVSRTETLVNVGGITNAFEYQIQKNLKQHATNIELALMLGTKGSGNVSTARALGGVLSQISTNKTARNSGDSLSETIFNDFMAMIKSTTDDIADEVYVQTTLKRDISQFSGRSQVRFVMDVDDKRIVNTSSFYESEFGMHKYLVHIKFNYMLEVPKVLDTKKDLVYNESICTKLLVKIQEMKQWIISRKDFFIGSLDLLMEKDVSIFLIGAVS